MEETGWVGGGGEGARWQPQDQERVQTAGQAGGLKGGMDKGRGGEESERYFRFPLPSWQGGACHRRGIGARVGATWNRGRATLTALTQRERQQAGAGRRWRTKSISDGAKHDQAQVQWVPLPHSHPPAALHALKFLQYGTASTTPTMWVTASRLARLRRIVVVTDGARRSRPGLQCIPH